MSCSLRKYFEFDLGYLLPSLMVVLAIHSTTSAAIIQADFNGLSIGTLKNQAAVGTGLTGNWNSTSSVPDIFAGDLTAPAGTNFNLTQSTGNGPQSVRIDNVERQNGADLSTSLTGTVWGTFLINTNNGGTAGIGINSVEGFSTLNGRPRLLADGTGLVFRNGFQGTVGAVETIVDDVLPATGDSLILFKIVFDGSTGFTIDAWANPDLSAPLPAADLMSATGLDPSSLSFNRLAVGGSRFSSGNNSFVDFITISDGPNAFQDVTGAAPAVIPEPTSLIILFAGIISPFALRQRRSVL